jgi:hypothetical protein
MENNLHIKKFERSLNKFVASMNLRRKDVPRSYVETKTIKRIEEACSSQWLQIIPNNTVADRGHAQMLMLPCCSLFLELCHGKPFPTARCFYLRGEGGCVKLQDRRWRRHTLVRVGGDLLDLGEATVCTEGFIIKEHRLRVNLRQT